MFFGILKLRKCIYALIYSYKCTVSKQIHGCCWGFFFNETILRKKNNKPCNLLKIFGHGIFIVIFDDLILLCDFPKQNHVISDMNSSDR